MHAALSDRVGGPAAVPRVSLYAATIGCRVPRVDCAGRVETVFENACNVLLDDGRRMTVLSHQAGNVAHGVRLAREYSFKRNLRPAMPVLHSAERMLLDRGVVTVMLSAAPIWTPALRPGMCAGNERSLRAVTRVVDLLSEHANHSDSEFLAAVLQLRSAVTPLAIRIAAIIPALAIATRTGEHDAALRLVAQLIGLGPGLTPAGDDFLIGWLAGLAMTARTSTQIEFMREMCSGVTALQVTTTAISAQHLDDACALMFSERLSDVCTAIAAGASKELLTSRVAAQVAVGSTSGADGAAGLVYALIDCGLLGRHRK